MVNTKYLSDCSKKSFFLSSDSDPDDPNDEDYVEPTKENKKKPEHSEENSTKTGGTKVIQTSFRKRSYSESDQYENLIKKRSRYDLYFRKQSRDQQIDILKKEEEVDKYYTEEIPIRYKILFSKMSISMKSLIIQKIDVYETMEPSDVEFFKLGKWIKGIAMMPFEIYVSMPVQISDGNAKIQEFLYKSYKTLQGTIYGQENAKNKIMQILAQWISNPSSHGQVIALEGPPGVGKTSLIKHGVSKAIDRPFCFYALGGASDISHLEGHSYTYEGATWGRISEMLMESKVMNPIVFFDELDKISDTPRGQEVSGLLTHLTDTTQNATYQDKYFSGINIDLSKVLFFFSFNNIEHINPILKDRLTIIPFNGYSTEEKIKISQNHLLPEIMKDIGFNKEDILFDEPSITYIIEKYTNEEQGVRNMKRCFEEIVLKLNLLKLTIKTDTSSTKETIPLPYVIPNLTFPFKMNKTYVDKLLSVHKKPDNTSFSMLYL